METLENLLERTWKVISYKAGALLYGESGIVKDVEHLGSYDPNTKEHRLYPKDDFGGLTPEITFVNPLGRLVKRIPKLVLEESFDPMAEVVDHSWVYPEYKKGDRYP